MVLFPYLGMFLRLRSPSDHQTNNGFMYFVFCVSTYQFWGPDKDANRLDPAMFEDLNRYCWIQQSNTASAPTSNSTSNNATNSNTNNSNNGALNNQVADTDGQV